MLYILSPMVNPKKIDQNMRMKTTRPTQPPQPQPTVVDCSDIVRSFLADCLNYSVHHNLIVEGIMIDSESIGITHNLVDMLRRNADIVVTVNRIGCNNRAMFSDIVRHNN